MSTELVLLVSDLLIPLKSPDIDSQFKSILVPNKIQHVLCLGNIGNQQTFDWLHGLSGDFHVVKGDFDINKNLPEKKVVQIGNYTIGMIHGHQIIPMGDLEILADVQRELDCDILVSGYTHQLSIKTKENKLYINPGSITGALSPMSEDCVPSFILIALQGEDATIYTYILNDKSKKFEVGQIEYFRGSDELKFVKQDEEENKIEEENKVEGENKVEEEKNNINNENQNENNINNDKEIKNDESKNVEEKNEENVEANELIQDNNPSSLNQNEEEVKEADNKDEKIDE